MRDTVFPWHISFTYLNAWMQQKYHLVMWFAGKKVRRSNASIYICRLRWKRTAMRDISFYTDINTHLNAWLQQKYQVQTLYLTVTCLGWPQLSHSMIIVLHRDFLFDVFNKSDRKSWSVLQWPLGKYQEVPPQKDLLGGPSWGGTSWLPEVGLPEPRNRYF